METLLQARNRTWVVTATAVVAVAYSWIAGGLRPFTQPMNVAVAVPVVAVVVLVGLRPRADRYLERAPIGQADARVQEPQFPLVAPSAPGRSGHARAYRRGLSGQARGGALMWVVLFGALAAWELTAFFSSPRHDHPTLSSIADTIMSTHPGRAGMFLAWLALGGVLAFRPPAHP
jgi:hypothetical protein